MDGMYGCLCVCPLVRPPCHVFVCPRPRIPFRRVRRVSMGRANSMVRLDGMLMYECMSDATGRPIGRDWNGVCMGGYMNIDMTFSGMAQYRGQPSHNYIYIYMYVFMCMCHIR